MRPWHRTAIWLALPAVILPVAAWAGPLADRAAGYSLTGEAERPLAEIVPDRGMAPAELAPDFWHDLPGEPLPGGELVFDGDGLAPAGPVAPAPDTPPAPAGTGAPATAGFTVSIGDTPAGWRALEYHGATFAVPPDWTRVVDKRDQQIYFGGDPGKRTGPAFGIGLTDDIEDVIDDAPVISRDLVTMPAGQAYHRVVYEARLDKTTTLRGTMFLSALPVEDDTHLTANVMVFAGDPADHAETFRTILATLRLPPPAPPGGPVAGTALGGVLTYVMPADWSTLGRADDTRLVLRPEIYSGYLHFARGEEVTGENGLLRLKPAGAAGERDVILGHRATRYDWAGPAGEFLDGNRLAAGRYRLFMLEECLDGNEPVAILVAGTPSFLDGEAVRDFIEGSELDLPWAAQPCDFGEGAGGRPLTAEEQLGFARDGTRRAAPSDTPPSSPGEPISEGPAGDPADTPTDAPATARPEQGQPSPAAGAANAVRGRPVSVGAARFLLPEGWRPQWDNPDDKGFASADGRLTILAFWWLPDEPLTAFDDVVAVEHAVVDREPVTVIRSDFGTRVGIQTVTERARSDGKRFIFTVEGETTMAELAALQARIVSTLRYGDSFGAGTGGRSGPDAGPAPAQVTPTPTGGKDLRVTFADGGTGGWTGEFARLGNPGSGGPDGRGYLSAFTPGDGITGYLVAPTALLGDWRGYSAIRTTMITGEGTPVGPYEYRGVGDIRISSGRFSASAVYPRPVGSSWTTQEIPLADGAGWRLEGGAGSLAEVLANVTRVELRAEFLSGDAEAGLAELVLVAGPTGHANAPATSSPLMPVPQPPLATEADAELPDRDRFEDQGGGYTLYVNDRYGTTIAYPGGFFQPDPPPANGDGRSFVSVDGSARFHVFAQYNALDLDQAERIARHKADGRGPASYERSGPGWYVLSGITGERIYYLRSVDDGDGLVRVFEISYPVSRKAEFDAVVAYMAQSFGPGGASEAGVRTPSETGGSATSPAVSSPALPSSRLGRLRTPKRGSAERAALMDAARAPVQADIGRSVIFVVDILRTDGNWAYLQGKPVNRDGSPVDWRRTPFAREMALGAMSDVVMVLFAKVSGRWQVIEYALGPTDVQWLDWARKYGLAERLFSAR